MTLSLKGASVSTPDSQLNLDPDDVNVASQASVDAGMTPEIVEEPSAQSVPSNYDNSSMMRNYNVQRTIATSDQAQANAYMEEFSDQDDTDTEVEYQKNITDYANDVVNLAGKAGDLAAQVAEDAPSADPVSIIAGGVADTAQGLINTGLDIADFIDNKLGLGLIPDDAKLDVVKDYLPKGNNSAENLARGIVSWLMPFGAGMKATSKLVSGAGKLAKFSRAGAVGAAADLVTVDPDEQLFSEMLQETGLANPVTEYLAAEGEEASRLERRVIGMVEGALLGTGAEAMAEGFGLGLKYIKQKRKFKTNQGVLDDVLDPVDTIEAEDQILDAHQAEIDGLPELPPELNEPTLPPLPEDEALMLAEEVTGHAPVVDPEEVLNINILKYDGKGDVRATTTAVAERVQGLIEVQKRGIQTHEQTLKKAQLLADNPEFMEDLLNKPIGSVENAEGLAAAGLVVESATKSMKKVGQAYLDGNADATQLNQAFMNYSELLSKYSGLGSESGRALNIFNMPLQGSARLKHVTDFVEKFNGVETVEHMAQVMSELSDEELVEVGMRATSTRMGDAINEVMINGMLSSPHTAAVNLSNIVPLVGNVLETGVGRLVTKARGRTGLADLKNIVKGEEFNDKIVEGIIEGEAGAVMRATFNSIPEIFKIAGWTLKTGKQASGIPTSSKYTELMNPAITSKNFPMFGKGADVIGSIIRIPTERMLGSLDEGFKHARRRVELTREGHIEAVRRGIPKEEREEFIAGFLSVPPLEASKRADEAARAGTFSQDFPEGGLLEKSEELLNQIPMRRVILPFYRTGMNITRETIARNPFIPTTSIATAKAIKAGGREADMEIAKVAVGGAALMAAVPLYLNGVLIGSAPKNRDAAKIFRESGQQENSIVVGGTVINISKLDPISKMLTFVANAGNALSAAGDNEEVAMQIEELMVGYSAAMMEAVTPDYVVDTFSDLFRAISEQDATEAKFMIEGLASRFVPFSGAARYARRITDPNKRILDNRFSETQSSKSIELIEGSLARIMDTLPGLSEKLPVKRNMFYEPILHAPGIEYAVMSPLATTKLKKSTAWKEIMRLGMASADFDPSELVGGDRGMRISTPTNVLTASSGGVTGKVQLNEFEYDQFLRHFSGIEKTENLKRHFGGRSLEEQIGHVVKTGYKDFTKNSAVFKGKKVNDVAKRLFISKIIKSYYSMAKAEMLKNPEVADRLKQDHAQSAQNITK